MEHHPRHKFNIYNELYPASSVAIIGTGIIAATMGELPIGGVVVLSGIAVGLAGSVVRAVHDYRISHRRH